MLRYWLHNNVIFFMFLSFFLKTLTLLDMIDKFSPISSKRYFQSRNIKFKKNRQNKNSDFFSHHVGIVVKKIDDFFLYFFISIICLFCSKFFAYYGLFNQKSDIPSHCR